MDKVKTLDKILNLIEENYYEDPKKQLDKCLNILIECSKDYEQQRSRYLILMRKYK